jgi:hypothetical protein
LNKSSSPQGNCKTFEENLLEEFAQELYLFTKMSVKKNLREKNQTLGLKRDDSNHCTIIFYFEMVVQEK